MEETTPMPMDKALGAIKSPPDYRDVHYSHVAAANPVAVPSSYKVDISKLPVWMQNQLGACTAHATGKYAQYKVLKGTGQIVDLSARYPYSWAKANDGIGLMEQGTYPRDCAKCLQNLGCATEQTLPNNTFLDFASYCFDARWANMPAAANEDAPAFKIGGYAFFDTINRDLLKQAIYQNDGVAMLVQVGAEWYTAPNGQASWSPADLFPLRPPAQVISGHEIYVYGYEDSADGTDTTFFLLNSWSAQWGENGTGWFNFSTYAPYIVEAITFVDLTPAAITALKSLPNRADFKHTFTQQLDLGASGEEVKALQTALLIDGEFAEGLYLELLNGNELGYFGALTQHALESFQAKYGIASTGTPETTGYGRVGPKTITELNNLFSV